MKNMKTQPVSAHDIVGVTEPALLFFGAFCKEEKLMWSRKYRYDGFFEVV